MTEEINASRMTMGLHAIVAIIIGYASSVVAFMYGTNWVGGALGVVALVGTGYMSEKLVRKKDLKFWAANGIFIYLFVWLVSWTYFINLF